MDKRKIIDEKINKITDDINSLYDWLDTLIYEEELEKIKFSITENMSEEELDNVINNLSKLELELLKYNKYLAADRSLDFDLSKISKEDIDRKLVMICVNKILKVLRKIDDDEIPFEYSEDLINHFYYIAYGLMERELLFSDDSLIYNYITKDKTKIDIIRKYIKEDYDNIRQLMLDEEFDEDTNELLAHSMFNIEFNDEEIFNKKIIRMIARVDSNNKKFVKKKSEQFNLIYEDLLIKISGLAYYINSKEQDENAISKLKKLKELKQREMKKRGISTILSLVILIGSYFGTSNILKQSSVSKNYNGTINTYSSVDNKTERQDILFDVEDNIEDNVKLNIYSKVYKSGLFKVRTVETYDVSDHYCSDLENYLKINLNNLQSDIKEKAYVDGSSVEKYYEVVKTKIDKSEIIENLNIFEYYSKLSVLLLVIELLLNLITISRKYHAEKIYTGIIFNLNKMFFGSDSILQSIKSVDETIDINTKEIETKNETIQKLLYEYKQQKDELLKMYYQYIVPDYDKLIKSINKKEKEKNKVKELIKNNLNKRM